jgi:hypothetical protein
MASLQLHSCRHLKDSIQCYRTGALAQGVALKKVECRIDTYSLPGLPSRITDATANSRV